MSSARSPSSALPCNTWDSRDDSTSARGEETWRASYPATGRRATRSNAREPGVPLVFPVPAWTRVHERHRQEILCHLVAELRRRVQAQRRAVGGRERVVVHAIGENRLRVQRAGEIPAVRVV